MPAVDTHSLSDIEGAVPRKGTRTGFTTGS